MKVAELQKAQVEMLNALEERGKNGDNQAAEIFLNQLRAISKDIEAWRQSKAASEPGKPVYQPAKPVYQKQNKPAPDRDLDPFQ